MPTPLHRVPRCACRRRLARAGRRVIRCSSRPATSSRSKQALAEAGEEFDSVCYIASGPHRGSFCHVSPDGDATPIERPNAYAASCRSSSARSSSICKADSTARRSAPGRASRSPRTTSSITATSQARLPVALAARLRRTHLLLLGYTLSDWTLRRRARAALGRGAARVRALGLCMRAPSRSSTSSGADATSRSSTWRRRRTWRSSRPSRSGGSDERAAGRPVQGPRRVRRLRARRAALLRPRARAGGDRRECPGEQADCSLRSERRREELTAPRRGCSAPSCARGRHRDRQRRLGGRAGRRPGVSGTRRRSRAGTDGGLVDTIAAAAQRSGEAYLLLDQFEDYFFHHGAEGMLADALPELLRAPGCESMC